MTQNPISLLIEAEQNIRNAQDALISLRKVLTKPTKLNTKKSAIFKHENGRLTDVGVRAVYDDFENGEKSHLQIAEDFKISTSAVSQRYETWKNQTI